MKTLIITILLLIVAIQLTGCSQEGIPVEVENKVKGSKFNVQLLFELEGVKMYRFEDNGYTHYFAVQAKKVLEKEDSSILVENTIPAGKSTKKDVIITIKGN